MPNWDRNLAPHDILKRKNLSKDRFGADILNRQNNRGSQRFLDVAQEDLATSMCSTSRATASRSAAKAIATTASRYPLRQVQKSLGSARGRLR